MRRLTSNKQVLGGSSVVAIDFFFFFCNKLRISLYQRKSLMSSFNDDKCKHSCNCFQIHKISSLKWPSFNFTCSLKTIISDCRYDHICSWNMHMLLVLRLLFWLILSNVNIAMLSKKFSSFTNLSSVYFPCLQFQINFC